jgi:hypothetical protein
MAEYAPHEILAKVYQPLLRQLVKRRVIAAAKAGKDPSLIPLDAVPKQLHADFQRGVPEGQVVAGWRVDELGPQELAMLMMLKGQGG